MPFSISDGSISSPYPKKLKMWTHVTKSEIKRLVFFPTSEIMIRGWENSKKYNHLQCCLGWG